MGHANRSWCRPRARGQRDARPQTHFWKQCAAESTQRRLSRLAPQQWEPHRRRLPCNGQRPSSASFPSTMSVGTVRWPHGHGMDRWTPGRAAGGRPTPSTLTHRVGEGKGCPGEQRVQGSCRPGRRGRWGPAPRGPQAHAPPPHPGGAPSVTCEHRRVLETWGGKRKR